MTDDRLLELIGERSVEDFTGAELAAIRLRLKHSPAVREGLRARLQLEQALHQTVGHVHLPIGLLLAKAAAVQATGTVAKLFGWGSVSSLLIGLVSVGIVSRYGAPQPAAKPPMNVKQVAEPESPSDDWPVIHAAGLVEHRSDAAPSRPEAHAAALAPPAKETIPADDPDEIFFADDMRAAAWRQSLEAISGDVTQRTVDDRPQLVVRGAHVLKADWPANRRMRLKLADHDRFRIHLSHSANDTSSPPPAGNGLPGASCLTLEFFAQPRPLWVAWLAARRANQALPETIALAAHDAGRLAEMSADTIDLTYHQGRVILTHADTQLLAAPLSGVPDRIVFEGQAVFQGVEFADGLAAMTRPALSRTELVDGAAKLEWQSALASGATWNVLPAGRVELLAEDTREESRAAFPVEQIYELVFELEDPLPGTGLYLCDDDSKTVHRLAFVAGDRPNQVCFALTAVEPENVHLSDGPAPVSPARVWFKLVAGEKLLRAWFSCDGEYWSPVLAPDLPINTPLSTVGVYCLAGSGTRSIRVARLAVRQPLPQVHPAGELFGQLSRELPDFWRFLK
jgi:hypothetical protein